MSDDINFGVPYLASQLINNPQRNSKQFSDGKEMMN